MFEWEGLYFHYYLLNDILRYLWFFQLDFLPLFTQIIDAEVPCSEEACGWLTCFQNLKSLRREGCRSLRGTSKKSILLEELRQRREGGAVMEFLPVHLSHCPLQIRKNWGKRREKSADLGGGGLGSDFSEIPGDTEGFKGAVVVATQFI